MISEGEDVAIISIGHMGNEVVKAIKSLTDAGIKPAHCDNTVP